MYKYIILLIIIIIIILIIGAVLGWFIKKKKQGICPFCIIKQHLFKSKITMNIPKEYYSGGEADTPPMGWSSWNTFRNNIDEQLILDTAAAVKATGLLEAGYKYINLDDCWQSSMRDSQGKLQGDLSRFPSGIKALTEKINEMGFKMGIYTSNGEYTCEDLPASLGSEKTDAETFAQWGIEYFKYDFCHNVKIPSEAPLVEKIEIKDAENNIYVLSSEDAVLTGMAKVKEDKRLETGKYISFLGHGKGRAEFKVSCNCEGEAVATFSIKKSGNYEKYLVIQVNNEYYELIIPETKAWSVSGRYQILIKISKGVNKISIFNPVCTRADSAFIQYKRMGEALKNVSKDKKITYSICEWGKNKPKNWAWNAGNLWRTTPDIRPIWKWIMVIYNVNLKLYRYAGPGHWNDPDMLEVGNGKLTFEENKSHFSLWCMMAAPLILGNDIRKLVNNNDKNDVLSILKNMRMIEINQDKKGKQCIRYKKTFAFDYLIKELENDNFAVCILNKSGSEKKVNFNLAEAPAEIVKGRKKLFDVWAEKEYEQSEISLKIPAHGCVVFKSF